MKKLIIFILATTLLFTACSQRETTAQLEKPAKIEVSSFTNEKTATNEKRSEFISSIKPTVGVIFFVYYLYCMRNETIMDQINIGRFIAGCRKR